MPKACLAFAVALVLSSVPVFASETVDAAANSAAVAALRDLAAARSLDGTDMAAQMERLRLLASARFAVQEVLWEHEASALAVRIALGEIPELSIDRLDAAVLDARASLAQAVMTCPDRRACLLDLARGVANRLEDTKARINALYGIALGLRDARRVPALVSMVEAQPSSDSPDLDGNAARILGDIAAALARDGEFETALQSLEAVPASERGHEVRMLSVTLLELGQFEIAARLAEHPSLIARDRDELIGGLLVDCAERGDAAAAIYWNGRMGSAADFKRKEAVEVAALSGDAALARAILASMPSGSHKASAEIAEAGAARNIGRLAAFADQVEALEYSTLKTSLLNDLAVQFHFIGEVDRGRRLGKLAGDRAELNYKLTRLYIKTGQIENVLDAAEGSGERRVLAISDIAVEILSRDGVAAAQRFVESHDAPGYATTQVFRELRGRGRIAEAVSYGDAFSFLRDDTNLAAAFDLGRSDMFEADVIRALAIRDPASKATALAALAYRSGP